MVHRGILLESNGSEVVVAVKLLSSPDPEDRVRLLREAMLMAQFNHPNILTLIGAVTQSDPLMLVLEFMPDGALDGVLRTRNLELQTLLQFTIDICSAMEYLASKRFIHRDLAAYVCCRFAYNLLNQCIDVIVLLSSLRL
jgi:proto-oncogene tyrosine-protein kinase Met